MLCPSHADRPIYSGLRYGGLDFLTLRIPSVSNLVTNTAPLVEYVVGLLLAHSTLEGSEIQASPYIVGTGSASFIVSHVRVRSWSRISCFLAQDKTCTKKLTH
jgi:hypothetical protein